MVPQVNATKCANGNPATPFGLRGRLRRRTRFLSLPYSVKKKTCQVAGFLFLWRCRESNPGPRKVTDDIYKHRLCIVSDPKLKPKAGLFRTSSPIFNFQSDEAKTRSDPKSVTPERQNLGDSISGRRSQLSCDSCNRNVRINIGGYNIVVDVGSYSF